MTILYKFQRAFASLALLCLSAGLHAQLDRGQISGFVRDPSSAAIVNVNVVVRNETTLQVTQVKTNESGYYQAPDLVTGLYTVEAEAPGFKKFVESHVKLDAASVATVDISLAVGTLNESVNIVANATPLQTDSAQVGRVVEAKQIEDLTLNGRNPLYLPLLLPGVNSSSSISTFDPDGLGNGNFSINGGRTDENMIYVDGAIALRTRANGAILGTLNVDTVQEVQVLTADYSAEYGRVSAGQIRYITKSGGHDFHGGLWEYFKNDALNTNTWARNASGVASQASPAPYRFNEFGYALGGPIYIPKKFNVDRNKLFFFSSIEWIRWNQYSTSTATVPSLAMRQGDFSELLSPTNIFFGKGRVITDPVSGQPFPGNIIPASRLSPNGIALLNTYPAPTPGIATVGAINWTATRRDPRDTSQNTFKVDYRINDKNTLSVRGTIYEFHETQPFRGSFDLVQLQSNRPNYTSVASLTTILSPSLINEAAFTASEDRDWNNVYNNGKYDRSQYGLNFPYLFPGTKDLPNKIPTISIANFSTVDGGPYPSFSGGPIFVWTDTVTKIYGNHTFKFGVYVEHSGENDRDELMSSSTSGSTNNPNGQFNFSDTGTALTSGVAVANAALGLFNTYGEVGKKDYTPYRATATELFAQDGWKITSRLKFDYGLRYEHWPPWASLWGNIASFNPQFYDPNNAAVVDRKAGYIVSGPLYNGMTLPGATWNPGEIGRVPGAGDSSLQYLFHNLPAGLAQTNNIFDPRVGLAYSINAKTVIRTGAGAFHDRLSVNDNTLLGGNAPLQLIQVVSNGIADAPGGSAAGKFNFPSAVTMQDPVNKAPVAWNWNFTVQRELPWSMTLDAGYVGRSAYHLPRDRNINSLEPGTVQANPGVNQDALRPFQGYSTITLAENAAQSNYHGLQTQLNRRFSSGLGFGVSYTFSKSITNADTKSELLFDPFNASLSRGLSTLDHTHVLVFNYIYDLPFLRHNAGIFGKTLGGWEISGISQFQSGAALSVLGTVDQAGVGTGNGSQPWNVIGSPSINNQAFSISNGDQNYWFNPKVFSLPAPGTFGDGGRGIIRGPSSYIWNFALRKNFAVTEKLKFQLRGEAFNVFNHPNWSNPNVTATSSSFARVQSKTGDREIQVALRMDF
ncbi:MAG TPA: carboxypeptidase regulatory-like domain-containing protein [Bryobacteraceae bacterium]|nr:carboxypeptidase regulatory-like domain-containing protein [Bryobacteraceae bacterium]